LGLSWYLVHYGKYSSVCSRSTPQCLVLGDLPQIFLLPLQSAGVGALAGKDTLRSDVETEHGQMMEEKGLQAVEGRCFERENVGQERKSS